jgi:hypothetical protein
VSRSLGIEYGAIYRVTGPDGTVAVVNDPTSPYFVGFVDEQGGVTGLGRADVREQADDIPEEDGGIHGLFRRSRMPWTISVLLNTDPPSGNPAAPDEQTLLQQAMNATELDGVLEWWPSTVTEGVFVRFREQNATRPTGRRPKIMLCAGVSEDPRVYSRALKRQIIDPVALSAGGFAFPLVFPLKFATPLAGGDVIYQGGNASKTWPIFVITGPCSNPTIANTTTGQALQFSYSLAAGAALRVDTHPRRRRIEAGTASYDTDGNLVGATGLTARRQALAWSSSSWPRLVPGNNDLSVGFTSYSPGAGVLVEWRDAWG